MIQAKDVIEIGIIVIGAVVAWVTLRVQFERHENEDREEFKNLKDNMKEVFGRINHLEVKQGAYDQTSQHMTDSLNKIDIRLASIENLLRSRRQEDR